MNTEPNDHAWVNEYLVVALTGGLSGEEQARFDAHIHSCAECFDAFTVARDADRAVRRALDSLTPAAPVDRFEERLITTFREQNMKMRFHPLAKRAGFAVAAAVALAATGVFAQYVVQRDLLNNPISKQLAQQGGELGLNQIFARIIPRGRMIESVSRGETNDDWGVSAAAAATPQLKSEGSLRAFDAKYSDHLQMGPKDSAGEAAGDNNRPAVPSIHDVNEYYGRVGVGGGSGGGQRDAEAQRQLAGNSPRAQSNVFFHPGGNVQANAPVVAGVAAPFDIATVPADQMQDRRLPEKVALDLKKRVDRAQGQVAQSVNVDADIPVNAGPATTQPTMTTPAAAEIAEHKIIRNGNVEFEVRSFDDAFATISSVVGEEGGYVSSTSSDKLANGKVRGVIAIRVPPEHLDRMLLKLRALGELKSQQIGATDITKEYTDLESELRALRAMESRLIDIIKTGNGQVKDLVVAEKQLGEYRIRIEKIEGEIRYYNNLVGMATLTITAYEKDIQTPTAAQEQENISLNLETEDVEAKYAESRKVIEDAGGRIVESELKKHDAGEFAAQIVAEVPPLKADFVAVQLKQLGTVAAFNRDRKQTTTGGNGAPTVQVEQKPTRFSLSLYNLANIAPRETSVLTIAVRDVETAYKSVLTTVRKVPDDGKLRDVQPKPIGRVVTSGLNGQQPEQMTADIRADITAASADDVMQSVRSLGEVMASSVTENPDTANVTSAKRGVQLHLVNLASVPARESRSLSTVAASVPDAYAKFIAGLQALQTAGSAHILASQLNQSDPRTINASLAFDVQRDALPAIEKAFTDAGIDTLSRNIARSNDTANTLDSKVHFQIDELKSADTLPPQRTTTLGIEADSVERSMQNLRTLLDKDAAAHIQYSMSKEASGRVTGHLIADVPIGNSMVLLGQIRDLGGDEKVNQVVDNPEVPKTRFATERIDLTLSSRASIVGDDRGLGSTIRAALGSAVAALLWSLYLIVTGILFVGPWLAIAWLGWKLTHRRKAI